MYFISHEIMILDMLCIVGTKFFDESNSKNDFNLFSSVIDTELKILDKTIDYKYCNFLANSNIIKKIIQNKTSMTFIYTENVIFIYNSNLF